MPSLTRRTLSTVALVAVAATPALGAAPTAIQPGAPASIQPAASTASSDELTDVLYVSNNWGGTIDVLRGSGDYEKLGQINAIPDKKKRMAEIALNPIHWPIFLYIRHTAGEGHDQFVDDTYSTKDGKAVIVSRPSFADVVSIDTATNEINWRFKMTGFRSDHMAISPDGTRVAVSDSSANRVHVLDMATGDEVGTYSTGDRPHENVFSPDGKEIWTMSIGNVENSFDDVDQQRKDLLKGKRNITVVDATTFETKRTIDMRERLDDAGFDTHSDAVRPIAFTPDHSKAYFQVSYYGGFFEYDVAKDEITRNKTLPKNPALSPDRGTWVNDSRHHGLTMSPEGDKLCVAGTMDDYAMVVGREKLENGPIVGAKKPYWSTVSADGKDCIVSESESDSVTAISFDTGEKVTSVGVGDHPQRVRVGVIPSGWSGPKN